MGTKPAKVGRLAATLLKSGDPLRLYTPSPPSDPPAQRTPFTVQYSNLLPFGLTSHNTCAHKILHE